METEAYQLADALLAWLLLLAMCLVFYSLIWYTIKKFILVPYMKKKLRNNETTPKD